MKKTPREKTTLASFLGHITKEIISIYDDRIVKRTGSENDFGLRVAQYSLIRITKIIFKSG
mgnify:CR=1 FL=1